MKEKEKGRLFSTVAPLELSSSDDDFTPSALLPPTKSQSTANSSQRRKVLSLPRNAADRKPAAGPSRPSRGKSQRQEAPDDVAVRTSLLSLLGLSPEDLADDDEADAAETRSGEEDPEDTADRISKETMIRQRKLEDGVGKEGEAKKMRASVLESETEEEETESETELEDEDEGIPVRQPVGITIPGTEDGESDTEPETSALSLPIPVLRSSQSSQLNSEPTTQLRPAFLPTSAQSTIGALLLDPETGTQVPASINRFLRDYQRDGVRFFWNCWKEGRGGVLGDDMGLGKTIQVISFLAAITRRTGDARDADKRRKHVLKLQRRLFSSQLPPADSDSPTCLIVAPVSLVDNWARELDTWGWFEWAKYTSKMTRLEREDVVRDFRIGRLDIVLTSHDCARGDIEQLADLRWSVIFVDEAHKLKNPHSRLTEAMHRFQHGARFGMTGTAIQNSYLELWTLLDWANPGRVGRLSQWEFYVSRPLVLGQSSDATVSQKSRMETVKRGLVERLLPGMFLRRTKEIIKGQLPKKTDNVVFCRLTERQTAVYKLFLQHPDVDIIIKHAEPCECGSKKSRGECHHKFLTTSDPWSNGVLKYMSLFVKLSNHVALLYPSEHDTPDQRIRNRGYVEYLTEHFIDERELWRAPVVQYEPTLCGKWEVLSTFLKAWKEEGDSKVLIFSKSVKLLDILQTFVEQAAYEFCRLDGKVPAEKRMDEVDSFNTDPNVFIFLISTLAGGVGLNLTAANKVVIFDPNWNPAHDLQAMDRAYRIGQNRDVTVYRLLGAGSLEELVYARQLYKQAQMRIAYEGSDQRRYWAGVQGYRVKQGELFGIQNIFSLHETGLVVKSSIEKRLTEDFCWVLENVHTEMELEGLDMDDSEKGNQNALHFLLEEDSATHLPHEPSHPANENISNLKQKRKRSLEHDQLDAFLDSRKIHTHLNEEVLSRSAIDAERLKAERKAKRSKTLAPADDSWIPRRATKLPAQVFQDRLAMLEELGGADPDEPLGMDTVKKFVEMSANKQKRILAKIDRMIAAKKKVLPSEVILPSRLPF
ncbi:hypothetical protein DACRYDRAFT_23259 [Dacryopinax primogenitus]|uniref:P-loop containing nucleoside triphosphate hydrolase protein n=1 Tax=Dacryopinax primogenitus (strain DJM 731) TaxID=1858805 RepID=M5FX72_DACPD|nr:uncharacterized protein DACRYDRAFT_23259 [Dacryopinax primogenitus]EJU00345.1 hypothetical protein DACRYDRAFT_23259 [Dacryopinax primogenitus]